MPSARNGDLEIHFTVQGCGPAVVLVHSLLCSGAMWAPQLAPLAEHYRVINVDLRGHGRSGHINHGFALREMVEDVVAVLDHLGVEKAVWAGLSIGGMIAIRAALTVPQRVAALILMDTDAGAERAGNRFQYSAMGAFAKTVGITPLLPRVTRMMFGATTRREQPALVAEWQEHFRRLHVPSVARVLRAVARRDDLVGRLGEVKVPALVVVGAEDQILPPALSRRMHRALSDTRLVEIKRAGHLSTLERPEEVTAAMLGFLSEVNRQTA